MKNIVILSAVSLVAALPFVSTACSSSNSPMNTGGSTTSSHTTSSNTTTASTSTNSTSTTTGHPAPPTIGMQIDRMGRPAINTALNHSFDGNTTTAGNAKDAYNQSSDPTKWGSTFASEFAANLAILDALDGTCGNQPGYASPASPSSYATLAGALAADALWLNTAGATCTAYLAVEANALGLLTNTDCGGRAPSYDVIDVSYSVLAAGSLASPPPVGDGVSANDVAFTATFPYLAAPH